MDYYSKQFEKLKDILNQTKVYKDDSVRYKASNLEVKVDSTGEVSAHSYGWWKFITGDTESIVFNKYPYSPTTRRHQLKASYFLSVDQPNIAILELKYTDISLSNINLALEDEIIKAEKEIERIEGLIARPKSNKRKNKERLSDIANIQLHCAKVRLKLLSIN